MSNLNQLEKRDKQKQTSYKVKKTLLIILISLVLTAVIYIIGVNQNNDEGEERPIEYVITDDVVGFEINYVELSTNAVGDLDENVHPKLFLNEKKMVHDIVTKRANDEEKAKEDDESEEGESSAEEGEEVSEEDETTNGEETKETEESNGGITTEESEVEGFEEGTITSNLPVTGYLYDKEIGGYATETVDLGDLQVEVRVGFSLAKSIDSDSIVKEVESRQTETEEPTEEPTESTEGGEDSPFGEEEPVETESSGGEETEGETTEDTSTSETEEGDLDNLFEDLEEDSGE